MLTEVLNRIRKKMDYDRSKSPFENLNDFFGAVQMLRYELIEEKIDKRKKEILRSAWKNEFELKEITNRFQDEFAEHLIQVSMDEKVAETYSSILKQCKKLLRKISRYYSPTFTEVMILFRNSKNEIEQISIDSLSEAQRQSIHRSYELLGQMAKDLAEIVKDEEQEFKSIEYVRDKSTYEWIVDKNDFSELAMAIWGSGALKRTENRKMMPLTLARELGAFFGIKTLHFNQDIKLISERSGKRKQGEFLDTCKKNLLKTYEEILERKAAKS